LKLLLYLPSKELPAWRAAFAAALPQAEVRVWEKDLEWRADYVALWQPPGDILKHQTQLKAAFNLGAGVEALLRSVTLPPNVPLIRLEDAGMGRQMVEYVTWAVLRYFRRLDGYAAQQSRFEWRPHRPLRHAEFPVGVMGIGVLGAQVARALAALAFPVVGWSLSEKQIDGVRCFVGRAELDGFLGAARVLVCVLPHTADTEGLLDHDTLAKLPRDSYVINVGRGGLIVDEDLLAFLDSGHIAGATLDVFDQEPLPASHPYWRHPKVCVTPHIAADTLIEEAVAQVAEKIRRIERSEAVTGVVDRTRGY